MNSGSSVRCASDGHTLNAPQATTHICVTCATLTASRPYSSGSCRCRSDDICHTSLVFNFDFHLSFKCYCGKEYLTGVHNCPLHSQYTLHQIFS